MDIDIPHLLDQFGRLRLNYKSRHDPAYKDGRASQAPSVQYHSDDDRNLRYLYLFFERYLV